MIALSSSRHFAARSPRLGVLVSLFTIAAASAACGSAPEDGIGESTGQASAANGSVGGGTLTCNSAVRTCKVRNMPHFLQDDPMISKYPWHVYPDEAAAGLTSAQKGLNVRGGGCYDASIAMVASAALANRDPSLVAPSGTRTHEFLALASDASFTRLQKQQLYIPISNYDGGGPAHNFTTRTNALFFPEIVANLSAPFTASCNPLQYQNCGQFQASAGTADMLGVSAGNASTVTNSLLMLSLWYNWNAIIGFYWGSFPDFSDYHKVAVAGFDLDNDQYPLLINDPGSADATQMVHARIGMKAAGDPAANPFPDPTSASWPYFEYEGGNSDSTKVYNYVEFVERVTLTSQPRKPAPTAPQCSFVASCSGALSWSCATVAGEALSYAAAGADGTFGAPVAAGACTKNAGPFAHPQGKVNVKLCASNYSWTDPACVTQSVTVPSCAVVPRPFSCTTNPPVVCSVANPAPGCIPPVIGPAT